MLLRLISWPYIRAHVLRTLLTVAGIALGVGVFVGMNAANGSVGRAFTQTIDRIAGKTELQITAGESGFPEDVLERVQALAAVRVAVPAIEAVADTGIRGEGSLLVLGIDLTGDRSLREYDLESAEDAVIDDPLVFLAQPDSIMVSRTFAAQNGLAVSDQITLGTAGGDRRFTVRGIMRTGGLASAFGGSLAVMDVYAAQAMFGRGRTFDRIDLALTPGVTIDDGARQIAAALGAGYVVAPPSARGRQFESMIAGYSLMMQASSLFAVVIGMFIIYNTFATAVTERRKEIGILRALGATQAQIRRLFIGESILGGLIGALIGLAIGTLMARGIAVGIAGLLHDLFGAARDPGESSTSPSLLAVGVAMGIATSVVAALVPARAAARAAISSLAAGAACAWQSPPPSPRRRPPVCCWADPAAGCTADICSRSGRRCC
jgi:putative ABC transport system permease protein